jgi:hypothetical protein
MSWGSDALDWFGGLFDSGSSWGSDLGNYATDVFGKGGWLDRNSDLINKGRQVYNAFDAYNNRSNTRSNILDAYKQMMAQDQAYNAEYYKWAQDQQASNAAAQAANDRARRQAAAEALGVQKQMLEGLQGQYAPFTNTMKSLLPKMSKDYKQYLDSTSLLNQYLTPIVMKDLGRAPAPAYGMDVPQAAYSVSMPQAQGSVEFPSLEKILSGRA